MLRFIIFNIPQELIHKKYKTLIEYIQFLNVIKSELLNEYVSIKM